MNDVRLVSQRYNLQLRNCVVRSNWLDLGLHTATMSGCPIGHRNVTGLGIGDSLRRGGRDIDDMYDIAYNNVCIICHNYTSVWACWLAASTMCGAFERTRCLTYDTKTKRDHVCQMRIHVCVDWGRYKISGVEVGH